MFDPSKLSDLISKPVEAKTDPVYARLMQAAEIIRQRGWARGAACDASGAVCIMGAIHDVRVASETVPLRADAVVSAASRAMIRAERGADWNDRKCKSASEAISAIESVANALSPIKTEG